MSASHPHHSTVPGDRVPLREKVDLGFGRMVVEGTHGSQYVLVNPIYNMMEREAEE